MADDLVARLRTDLSLAQAYEAMHEAADELERLRSVALAARALVQSAETLPSGLDYSQQVVSEPALTALESALEAAGYGMSEEEATDV